MTRKSWKVCCRFLFRNRCFIVLGIILLSAPVNSYSFPSEEKLIGISPALSVSRTNNGELFIFTVTVIILASLITILILKLKAYQEEVKKKDEKIYKLNEEVNHYEEKNLESEEKSSTIDSYLNRFNETLVESSRDGISFYDCNWDLKYANASMFSMIGLSRDSDLLTDLKNFVHPEDTEIFSGNIQALEKSGFTEYEIRLKHKNGHYINTVNRSVIVRDDFDNILGSLTVSQDITDNKKIYNELIKAKEDAEAGERLKSSFLANMSHEIRTPLNSVVGFSNLLLAEDTPDDIKEEYVDHINYNSEKLLQIIGDIIDLSRLESSQIEITYEETSLTAIINDVINETRQVLKRNGKSIILNVKNYFENHVDVVFIDKNWLKRVLSHLMDNSVKFTLEGSIELSCSLSNENIVFKVGDTGVGIDRDYLKLIFKEFRQEADSHRRPFEGLGIGLTLAKGVIEKMGGKIFVKSEKGVGSEFSFFLPYRPAGKLKQKEKLSDRDFEKNAINWISKKCLLVDDNKDVLVYLNRVLLDTGVTIITARSAFDAIEIIKKTSDIDVVLLDMQMPEMNGVDLAREIRKIRKTLPIIAQTTFLFDNDKDIILEAGCDACLIKPVRKEHLITCMMSFIKSN